MNNPVIPHEDGPIYVLHHDDSDGFASAIPPYSLYKDRAKFIAVQYNQPFPNIELTPTTTVFILDFSYSREILEDVKSKVFALQVLDHHKTAEAALQGLDYAHFDMNKSGASLSWDYFFPMFKGVYPLLIRLVEDRDLWRFDLPHSKAFEAGMNATGKIKDLAFWLEVYRDDDLMGDILKTGEILVKNQEGIISSFVNSNKFTIVQFYAHRAALYNLTSLISDTAEALYSSSKLKLDLTISYFIATDGKIIFSLRSHKNSGVDVGSIARNFGGGGHTNAAGFTMDLTEGMMFLANLYNREGEV